MKRFLLILLLAGFLVGSIPVSFAQSSKFGATLYMGPATGSFTTGSTFTISFYVDTKVAAVETIDIYDFQMHAKGGGGTDFKPGFEYIEKEGISPACAVYFTDGWCSSYPEEVPGYPTLWVSTDRINFKPPFGEVINIGQQD